MVGFRVVLPTGYTRLSPQAPAVGATVKLPARMTEAQLPNALPDPTPEKTLMEWVLFCLPL